jgi:hypothetical protein
MNKIAYKINIKIDQIQSAINILMMSNYFSFKIVQTPLL